MENKSHTRLSQTFRIKIDAALIATIAVISVAAALLFLLAHLTLNGTISFDVFFIGILAIHLCGISLMFAINICSKRRKQRPLQVPPL